MSQSFIMSAWILVALVVLAIIGLFLVYQAFFGKSKHKKHKAFVIKGCIGLILLWLIGMVIIYFYALQPQASVVKEPETEQEELPDIS